MNTNKQELFAMPLDDLRVELFKRKLTFEKIAKKLDIHKSYLTILFKNLDNLSEKTKLKIKKRICTIIINHDKRLVN